MLFHLISEKLLYYIAKLIEHLLTPIDLLYKHTNLLTVKMRA